VVYYSCRDLMVENLALRQQLAVFKSKNQKPKLFPPDKALGWLDDSGVAGRHSLSLHSLVVAKDN